MRMSRRLAALILVGLMVALGFVNHAPSVSAVLSPNPPAQAWLQPNQTANVYSALPAVNFGNPATLKAQQISAGDQWWLMQFDVHQIPSNVVIVSADLQVTVETSLTAGASDLYLTGVTYAFLSVVRVTGTWNQNTVTWNTKPAFHATDFVDVQFVASDIGLTKDVALVPMVQGWVSGTFANDGILASWNIIVAAKASANFTGMTSASHTEVRPSLTIQYVPPTATIYPAYYCASGPCETQVLSGSGLPAYLFAVYYSENNGSLRRAIRPDILFTNVSTFFRLRVQDFWGNVLYNQARMWNVVQGAWNVSINYALLNVYNMRDAYTNLSAQPAAGTPMILFLPPRGWYTFPLHVGTAYYLNFTLLNANFGIVSTINLIRTMPSYGLAYMVNGTSLTEVRQVQSGQWDTENGTRGVAGATGNAVLGLYQFNLFKPIGPFIPVLGWVSVWLLLFFAEIIGAVAWAVAYGGRVRKTGLRIAKVERAVKGLPVRANVLLALLIIMGLFVFATWVFNRAGAQVLIPLPFGP